MRGYDDWGDCGTNTERIVFFSDAVFAIAITLLVLEIKVPELMPAAGAWQNVESLLALWPKLLSFAISFGVIGAAWTSHHRIFSYIQGFDRRLIWLNLMLLLSIVFMPMPTEILGESGPETVSVILYASVLALAALVEWAIWSYATRHHRLVAPDLERRIITYNAARPLLVFLIFGLSIGLAWITRAWRRHPRRRSSWFDQRYVAPLSDARSTWGAAMWHSAERAV